MLMIGRPLVHGPPPGAWVADLIGVILGVQDRYDVMNEFLSRIASSVLRVNCYQRGSCLGGPSAFNSPFGHGSRSHNIRPLDNHPLWFIDIALKLGAQLSISIAIFQVFGMTRL